jgi:hypothetical protein
VSYSEITGDTDIERIEAKMDFIHARQDKLTEAVNSVGANMQWVIDNVQGIFKMLNSPQFMARLPQMMNPAVMQDMAETNDKEEK